MKKTSGSKVVAKGAEIDHDENSDIDENSDSEELVKGYCHFNETNDTSFTAELFGRRLQLSQLPGDQALGHGAVVWDAAVVFCKYMEFNPSIFSVNSLKDQRILELGAGCGLSGLAYMMKGAVVTLTDLPGVVEHLTRPNSKKIFHELKSLGNVGMQLHEPEVISLDWTICCAELSGRIFNTILLTDCVFSVELAPFLIETILRYSNNQTEIICCHEIRDEDANKYFVSLLKEHCSVKRISSSKLCPEFRSDQIEILVAKMKRKKSENQKDQSIVV